MTDDPHDIEKELVRLKERLKRVSREKANLQMGVNLINQVADAAGATDTTGPADVISQILRILMGVIGGSNMAVYYEADGRWHYTDILGTRKSLDEIDDELVKAAVERQVFLKAKETGDSRLAVAGLSADYETWVYPLSVQGVFFAAIRLQGLAIEHAHYQANIDPFIQYAALVLYHEVSSVKKLRAAYREVNAAKDELQQSNRLLNSVIGNSPQAIIAFDTNKVITLWSNAAVLLFGLASRETVGNKTHTVFARFSPEFEKAFTQGLSGNKVEDLEIRCIRKDRPAFYASLSVSPISDKLDSSGPMQGGMAVIADISWRIKMEEHMRQVQKMEAIGTLAGGIAHDFNNILSPILGFSEMLKEDLPPDSPDHEKISRIYEASIRARDLVDQILTFSRRQSRELKPLKIQAILKEALKLLRSSIPRTIAFETHIDPGCGAVIADPTQIHQVIMNLVTNAYHAMRESGGRLKVTLEQIRIESETSLFSQLGPGAYARLTVSDTGTGIEKDVLEKIFDPYFTTKAQNEGTGLGLSVVQGIVKSCRGDIHIYSEPGKGTEIHVYLPVKEKKPEPVAPGPTTLPTGTERILLVDDETAILRIEEQIIQRLGYRVTSMGGSREAFDAFSKRPGDFDLIITDMTMPHMTGMQLAQKVKSIRPDIPVVICTGFSDQISKETWQAAGIQGFVTKPVLKRQMARTIRDALDNT